MELVYESAMKKLWDKWGIALSAACIVHCIAVVFLPLMLPAVEMMVHSPWVHRIFAIIIIFTSPLAFIPGYRRHGLHRVLFFAMAGLTLILMGIFLDGAISEYVTHSMSILGSASLVYAHIKNLRHAHKHEHDHCC